MPYEVKMPGKPDRDTASEGFFEDSNEWLILFLDLSFPKNSIVFTPLQYEIIFLQYTI